MSLNLGAIQNLVNLHKSHFKWNCHKMSILQQLDTFIMNSMLKTVYTPFTQLLQTRVCFTNAGINNNKI